MKHSLPALALTFALLAAPAFAAKKEKEPPAPKTALEAEFAVAQTIDLYLVLRPAAKALEVRSRGTVLATVPVAAVEVLRYRAPRGVTTQPAAVPTFFWTVSEDVDLSHRKLIAPEELRPYPEENAAQEEEHAQLPVSTAPAKAEPLPEPPAEYRIALDQGWQLWVRGEVPPTDLKSRLTYAFHEGWGRLRGREPETRDQLVVAVSPADAKRLHHLFRAGTRIFFD